MDPELKALLDRYTARFPDATADDLKGLAAHWQQTKDNSAFTPSNMGNAIMHGATYHWGDRFGVVDPQKEKDFANANPISDFALQLLGGAAAPAVAALAAPEAVGGAAGATAIGGITSALESKADEKPGTPDFPLYIPGTGMVNVPPWVPAGIAGMIGGRLAHGAAQKLGGVVNAVADRIDPTRRLGTAAQHVITPEVAQRMAQVEALAPGGTSVGTATRPVELNGLPAYDDTPRFLSSLGNMSAKPGAAAEAEQVLLRQEATLQKGMNAVGDKMNALNGDIQVTPKMQTALENAQDIVGAKRSPDITATPASPILNAQGQPITPQGPDMVNIQDARRTLSVLRQMIRDTPPESRGVDYYKITQAEKALSTELRAARPDFAPLDKDFAVLSNEQDAARAERTAIFKARSAALNKGIKGSATMPSLPTRLAHLPAAALDALTGGPEKTAQAILDYVVRPSASPDALLALAPKPMPRAARAAIQGTISTLPASLAGLFGPQPNAQ